MVLLDVADHRLDRLTPLEPSSLFIAQPLGLAPVDQLDGCDVLIRTSEAKVHDGRGGLDLQVLQQRGGLLQLCGQGVAVIRVARQSGDMGDELAALASAQRCRQRDLDAVAPAVDETPS